MFSTILAALAVLIALQALRLASRDRITIQVQSESATAISPSLELPPFLTKAQSMSKPASKPVSKPVRVPEPEPIISFLQGSPLDVHLN